MRIQRNGLTIGNVHQLIRLVEIHEHKFGQFFPSPGLIFNLCKSRRNLNIALTEASIS